MAGEKITPDDTYRNKDLLYFYPYKRMYHISDKTIKR